MTFVDGALTTPIEIVLRIFLSLIIGNCNGERSFSTLKCVKSELKNSMGQNRLINLN